MAVTIIDPRIWFAQYHLSADHNKVTLEIGSEEKNGTVFTNTAKNSVSVLPMVSLTGGGFVTLGNGNVHQILKSNVNVADVPVTIGLNGGTEGTKAEFFKARTVKYTVGGDVGEIMPFTWTAKGQGDPAVDGTILSVGTKTVTGDSTVRLLGVPSTSQRIYAALHVLAVSGTSPTLDATLLSDDADSFLSPATRLTFAQKTAEGSEFLSAQGTASTDNRWAIRLTIGGTNPSFNIVVVAGIA